MCLCYFVSITTIFLLKEPWSCEWKHTTWNDDGGGNSRYLDRHLLSCEEGKGINYFHLERKDGKYRYKYRCCTTQLQCKNVRKTTPLNDDGNGNAIFLDRHNVDCNEQYINNFKLQRDGSKVKYTYTCCKMPDKKTCVTEQTPMNDDGGGNAIFLDRHEVKCKDNFALSQFKLSRSRGGKKYRYQFTCCQTNAPGKDVAIPIIICITILNCVNSFFLQNGMTSNLFERT